MKPIENRRVRAVASERYPLNQMCSHPECNENAVDPHHAFPRSAIGGDSWFVEITGGVPGEEGVPGIKQIVPHVTGICRAHHDQVEDHRAWIKLEDGEFVWYDRQKTPQEAIGASLEPSEGEWVRLGVLNPQPGSREGKPKRKRTVKGTEGRTQRKTVSVRLPEGVNGDYWDELLADAEGVELQQPETPFDPGRGGVAIGKLLVTVLERFTGRIG